MNRRNFLKSLTGSLVLLGLPVAYKARSTTLISIPAGFTCGGPLMHGSIFNMTVSEDHDARYWGTKPFIPGVYSKELLKKYYASSPVFDQMIANVQMKTNPPRVGDASDLRNGYGDIYQTVMYKSKIWSERALFPNSVVPLDDTPKYRLIPLRDFYCNPEETG